MQIDELKEQLAKCRERYKKAGQKVLKAMMEDIFNTHENIKNISWTQYAPYFNDGDACVFSVNSYNISVNEENIDEYYNSEETLDGMNYDVLQVISKKFEELVSTVGDEIFQELYGDDVEVTLHRNGSSDVNDYSDHD